jgi:hypothetical protein
MEKCAMLQQELDKLSEENLNLKELYADALGAEDFWEFDSKATQERAKESFKNFNALPWYKKMFFKFNI